MENSWILFIFFIIILILFNTSQAFNYLIKEGYIKKVFFINFEASLILEKKPEMSINYKINFNASK